MFGGKVVAQRNTTSGVVTMLIGDHLGSVSATTNLSGVRQSVQYFDPWGKIRSGNVQASTFNYTGQRRDDTGLLYDNARYRIFGISMGVCLSVFGFLNTGYSLYSGDTARYRIFGISMGVCLSVFGFLNTGYSLYQLIVSQAVTLPVSPSPVAPGGRAVAHRRIPAEHATHRNARIVGSGTALQ